MIETNWKAYVGMDKATLQQHKATLKSQSNMYADFCENDRRKIAEIEQEIEQYKGYIEKCELALKAIEKAEKNMPKIEYENIAVIQRAEKTVYVGKGPCTYYSASDFKKYIELSFIIVQANKLGFTYGRTTLDKSRGYEVKEKSNFNEALFNACHQYNVHKVYVPEGVRVNMARLKVLNIECLGLSREDESYFR